MTLSAARPRRASGLWSDGRSTAQGRKALTSRNSTEKRQKNSVIFGQIDSLSMFSVENI